MGPDFRVDQEVQDPQALLLVPVNLAGLRVPMVRVAHEVRTVPY